MTLPAFASIEDLGARLPGGLRESDEARAQAVLDDASSLIRAEAGKTWVDDSDALVDDVPDIVVTVTLRSAIRAMENPTDATQESVSGYSATYASAYLTSNERRLVRDAAGRRAVAALSTTRGDLETEPICDPYGWVGNDSPPSTGITDEATGTQFLPVDPSGKPIPGWGPDGY